jgi:hypothetical protein
MRIMRKFTVIPAAVALLAVGGGAAAWAASTPAPAVQPAGAVHACVLPTGHLDFLQFRAANYGKCAKGDAAWTWAQQGPAGAAGAQGPSGVVSTGTHDLGAVASVPTGGSFAANAVPVGTVQLAAGTYLVTVGAKATPAAGVTGQTFPTFAVYDQALSSTFAGDLFNVGGQGLESSTTPTIDSYFSGTAQVTETQPTTLRVYAGGYQSDQSAGHYGLDDLTVTATQITPAS